MPNYFYNSNFRDAADYGQGLGQALGQALIGLPERRAELQLQLAQLQQAGQYKQGLMGLREEQLRNNSDYHQGLLQEQNDRLKQQGEYETNRLQSLDQYRQLQEQIRMLQAQTAAQNANSLGGYRQFQEQRPYALGGGAIWSQPGQPPMPQPGIPQQDIPQQEGVPTGQPNLLPTGQPNLPPGVTMLPHNPSANAGAPGAQDSLIGRLNAQALNSMGTNATPAQVDFVRTNVLPLLINLQNRMQGGSQGLPQTPPARLSNTNKVLNWNPQTNRLE